MQRYKLIIDFADLGNMNMYDLYAAFQNNREVEADIELCNIHYLSYFGGDFNDLINSIPNDDENKLNFIAKVDGSTIGFFGGLTPHHIQELFDRNVKLEISNVGNNIQAFFMRPRG